MDQKQTLTTLILLSIGLSDQQKQDLIQRIGGFSSLQIQEMILLFEAEQSIKDRLLKKKFEENPKLAEQYETKLQSIASNTRKNAEQVEHSQNDESRIQGLFKQLDEL